MDININIGFTPTLLSFCQTGLTFLKAIVEGFSIRQEQLDTIKAQNQQLIEGQKEIMATEQQVIDALAKIDTATNAIASNVSTIASGLNTVSGEVDALVAALKNAGVSDALVAQATALGDKASAAADALAAQVPVLNAIAAKGVLNPVPQPPPPPPPPPPSV